MFNLNLIELPQLIRHDGESRHYETPTGQKYPSVTTVLDKTSDKTFLHEWRKRIGAEAADKITKQAANRGTAMHSLCEKFVLNEDLDLSAAMPLHIHLYKQLETPLRDHVDNIRVSEGSLFSHRLDCRLCRSRSRLEGCSVSHRFQIITQIQAQRMD